LNMAVTSVREGVARKSVAWSFFFTPYLCGTVW
jgi:hypothetical protein